MKAWNRVNWPAVAIVMWGTIGLGIAIQGFVWPLDHSIYTTACAPAVHRWWAGQDLYEGASPLTGFRYGPPFAVLLAPFAMLPDNWGNAAWKLFTCAFYTLAVGMAGTRLLPRSLSRNQLAAFILLALPLSLESMHNGQPGVIMLVAILLGLSAAAEDRWNLAAVCLAMATLIKGYPLALTLVLAVLYPRRFPLRYLAAIGLGLALPLAWQTPSEAMAQTVNWIKHLTMSAGVTRGNVSRSFDSLFDIYGNGIGNRTFLVLEILTGAAVLGLSLWQARSEGGGASGEGRDLPCLSSLIRMDQRVVLTRVFVLFAIWVVLFGPATESCTYVIAAPAIAWSLVEIFDQPAWWVTRVLLAVSLLLMGPLVTDLFGPTVRAVAIAHGSQPLGALLFLGCVLAPNRRKLVASEQPGMHTQPMAARRIAA
jgi:hypothetical protein